MLRPSFALAGVIAFGGLVKAQGFQAPVFVNITGTPEELMGGDFNGDGLPDLLVRSETAFRTQLQTGPNTLTPGPSMAMATVQDRGPAVADMNLDGILDAVTAAPFAVAVVYLHFGDGLGAFSSPQSIVNPGVTPIADPRVGDFDGDGRPDVAEIGNATSTGPGLFFVFRNLSANPFATISGATLTAMSTSLTTGDVNGDGLADGIVATMLIGSNAVSLETVLGASSGPLVNGPVSPLAPTEPLMRLEAAHLNSDGILDIEGIIREGPLVGPKLVTTLGLGGGAFGPTLTPLVQFATSSPFNFFSDVSAIAAVDLNQDGNAEAVATHGLTSIFGFPTAAPTVWSVLGTPAGPTGPAGQLTLSGTSDKTGGLTVLDFDSDGRVDVICGRGMSSSLAIVKGVPPPSTGLLPFGTGTPGCSGLLAIAGMGLPNVGNVNFGYSVTNAPPRSLGFVLATDVLDIPGSDALGLGLLLHASFAGATEVYAFDIHFDNGGTGVITTPISNNPTVAGMVYAVQAIGLESPGIGQACSPAAAHLVSSIGLQVTIQP